MSIKIQINSLEAIERLIGGDSELEIQVRESVVQSFAKKHLKPLIASEAMDEVAKSIKDEIITKVWPKRKLRDNIEKLIETQVNQCIAKAINPDASKIYDELRAKYTKKVEGLAEAVIERVTEAQFENRVYAEVDKRLKAIKDGI